MFINQHIEFFYRCICFRDICFQVLEKLHSFLEICKVCKIFKRKTLGSIFLCLSTMLHSVLRKALCSSIFQVLQRSMNKLEDFGFFCFLPFEFCIMKTRSNGGFLCIVSGEAWRNSLCGITRSQCRVRKRRQVQRPLIEALLEF